jgi:ABC-type uncharacterized transport system involved in gliding motility auxiliary subunit
MKRYETLIYSAGGVIAVFVILLLINFVFGAFKSRVDLTEGGLYTLSNGTRTILDKLDAPVKIRFYYSQSEQNVPLPIKGFARRVEDLLGEFRQAAGGKVLVERLDPQPDSDAEDSAGLDGVEAQTRSATPTRRSPCRRCPWTASSCSSTTSRAPSRGRRARTSPCSAC